MPLSAARLLLVDDDPLHLEVFHEWLTAFGAHVSLAPDGEAALDMVQPGGCDVAVIDLNLPGLSGLDLLDRLKQRDPSLVIIILTGSRSMQDAIAALRQGRAFDFLLKPVADLRQINEAIAQALACRRALRTVRTSASLPSPAFIEELTPRERETLSLLAKGMDNREISQRLHVCEKTVRNALTRIYEKLKVTSRCQAIIACKQFGLGGSDS